MNIELWELNNIIKAAAKEAVRQYVLHQEPTKDEINERQAFKEFGRAWVLNQLANGMISPPKRAGATNRSPKVYSRSELSSLKYGADSLLTAVCK